MRAVHVPFTGGGPAVTAAIGNHVDSIVLTLPTVVPPITQGLLRGIGLASAFRIIQLHNGSIDFTSEVGRGTTFRIELPLAA